jgi:hypothetical protein
MEVKITIPDEVAASLQNAIQNGNNLARHLLELVTIQAYEADQITSREVQETLGFEDREELFAFFKKYNVKSKTSPQLLEKESETASALFGE